MVFPSTFLGIIGLTLFPDFTPFGEFMIIPINYICTYALYITEFVSFRTMFTD